MQIVSLFFDSPSSLHWLLIFAGYLVATARIVEAARTRADVRALALEAIRTETLSHNKWTWLETKHRRLLEAAKAADIAGQDKSVLDEELANLHAEIVEASRLIPCDEREFDAITERFIEKMSEKYEAVDAVVREKQRFTVPA